MMIAVVNFIIVTTTLMNIGDYDIYTQFLSALGTRSFGILFNSSLVFLAISTFLYFLSLGKSGRIGPITTIFGIFTAFLLSGIGIFVSGGWSSDIHNIFAITYFLALIPLYIYLPIQFKVPHGYKEILSLSGFLTSIMTIVALTVPVVNQYIFQKLIVLAQLVFLFCSSLYFFMSED